jgi:hypothetical protein
MGCSADQGRFRNGAICRVVENKRVARGRVVQRHVLYLGEINDSQELAWRKSIEVLEGGKQHPTTLSLFPEGRCEGLLSDNSIVRLKLSEFRLYRPRQMGCELAGAEPMAGVAARPLLVRTAACEPQRYAPGSGTVRACCLSAFFTGKRMATSSGMVWRERAI